MQKRLSIIVFFLFLIACSSKEDQRRSISTDKLGDADQVSRNIKVYFVDSSYTKAVLDGAIARIYNSRNETVIDSGLRVNFLDKEDGSSVSVLTADSATIDDITKNMIAEGNVVVISDSSKTKLTTSRLEWLDKRKKLFSSKYVEIESPNEIIKGYGFESDPDLTNYVILKVSGIQRIN